MTFTAPSGGVTAGTPVLIGDMFVIPQTTVAATYSFDGYAEGVHTLAKTSAQAWTEGQKIYWDNANSRCDSDAKLGLCIGVAAAVAANPSSTGSVRLNGIGSPRAVSVAAEGTPTPTSKATAGAVTLTAAEVLSGIIVVDTAGAGRTYTLPTAALLVAAVPQAKVGDVIRTYVVNGADAAEAITLAEGSGGGWDANQTATSRVIGQNTSKMVHIRLTNVTASSEAYVVYA